VTRPSEKRKYFRLDKNFHTEARLLHGSAVLSGITHNLSQSGAFIISPSWPDFQVDDEAEIMFFLPPEFTGQNDTVILKGLGTVRRVDGDRWGIAIEFPKELKTFEVYSANKR
jgi:hypothetical protein